MIPATNLTYGFSIPAPLTTTTSQDESSFSITYDASGLELKNSSHTTSGVQFDIWEPSEDDLYMETNDSSDSDSDFEMEVISVLLQLSSPLTQFIICRI